jgi:regulator of replication initiation timing
MTRAPSAATDSAIDRDLAALERKLVTLVTHTRALRAANETLRRELAAAYDKNRALAERVAVATERLDALLARLPEAAE